MTLPETVIIGLFVAVILIGLILILEKKHGVRTGDWLDWRWYAGYVVALGGAYFLQARFL